MIMVMLVAGRSIIERVVDTLHERFKVIDWRCRGGKDSGVSSCLRHCRDSESAV
jgi:hypothetical protein